MNGRRDRVRTIKTMFSLGFRADPRLMTASLALLAASGLAFSGPSLGSRLLVDGFLDDDNTRVVIASVIVATVSTFTWMAGIVGATTSGALSDRVRLYVSSRLAELANAVPGIEHFERPDYLTQLEQIELNRNLIGAGPQQLVYMVQSIFQVGATSILLGTVHPLLLLLPVIGVFPILCQSRSVRIRQRTEERLADERRLTNELFGLAATAATAKELRVFGLTAELQRQHQHHGEHVAREATAAAIRGAALAAAGWVLFASGMFAALLLVIHEAAHGRATPGEVLMAVGLAQLTQFQLMNVSNTVGQVLTTARAVQRYIWLEQYAADATPSRTHPARAVPDRLHDAITLDHVTFRYPGTETDVVRDLTLTVPAGATVALVGENGAGKTTLVKLLAGMYTPTSGQILIDGTPLSDFAIDEWRGRMSAAFQDFVKFELAARDVVGVGDLPARAEDTGILAALERAGAADVVDSLDDGLDTKLGRSFKGGRDLSGGQWQKLALGRAMMRPAPLLLVLDEPTSSLDAHTEGALFERYERAARRARSVTGAVTILVSHRFSTVRMADLIIVLETGKIVAAGTHRELMDERGLYAELYELQAQPYR